MKGIVISLWCSPFKQNNALSNKAFTSAFLYTSIPPAGGHGGNHGARRDGCSLSSPCSVPSTPPKLLFLRSLITSLCTSQQETPNWCLYLAPIHRANDRGDFPAMAHKSHLISMQEEFAIYWERPSFYCSWLVDVLYIYWHRISFAVYCSNIWNDLSLSHFTVAHCLLFLPITASQLQMLGSQTRHGHRLLVIATPG